MAKSNDRICISGKYFRIRRMKDNTYQVCCYSNPTSRSFKVVNSGSYMNCVAYLEEVLFCHSKIEEDN